MGIAALNPSCGPRDEDDLRRHMDYVHINPLKHLLVERVADWPHSTFRRYVARGMLPIDWAGPGAPLR